MLMKEWRERRSTIGRFHLIYKLDSFPEVIAVVSGSEGLGILSRAMVTWTAPFGSGILSALESRLRSFQSFLATRARVDYSRD